MLSIQLIFIEPGTFLKETIPEVNVFARSGKAIKMYAVLSFNEIYEYIQGKFWGEIPWSYCRRLISWLVRMPRHCNSCIHNIISNSLLTNHRPEHWLMCRPIQALLPNWRRISLCLAGKALRASPKSLEWLLTLPVFNVGSRKALTHYSFQPTPPFLS